LIKTSALLACRSEDPIKGSQASLVGSWPKINHDGVDGDQSSLDEYGDPEVGKFGEDGSFVGAYATNEGRNRGRTGSRGNY
jgi:Bravo-like intracellular region